MATSSHDHALSAFFAVRPRLFGIAYRMLGSVAEAEDIVQDVWLRWQSTNRGAVHDPAAFLATSTTRLAINLLQSAPARREKYVGTWLPEPVDTTLDPSLGAERAEALELAVLLLLERLSPTERAAYVLREAFDYSYQQIADMLQTSEANTRQLVSRARAHITDGRRTRVSPAEHRRLLDAFIAAAQQGNLAELEALFSSDIVSYSDGGGVVRAARKPVIGRDRVATFIVGFSSHFWSGVTVSWTEANGQPCMLLWRDGAVVTLFTIRASESGIDEIMWIMRPSKLASISQSRERLVQAHTPEVQPTE